MCGICGIFTNKISSRVDEVIIQKMCNVMNHRGPDGQGIYIDGNVGIAMRRLSIIDLETGDQPIHNEDKTIWIVCNCEIYNYLELKRDLDSLGHQFYTKGDVEPIIHAYEQYGIQCVEKLRGMFAFALWDSNKKMLLLARDRLGIKPLYYSIKGGQIVFGSELKSVLQHPDISKEIDLRSLDTYLTYLYVPAPYSIWSGINKLMPGYFMVFKDGEGSIQQYWDLDFRQNNNRQPEEYYEERLYELLKESIKMHLASDVPLGAFLSGGLDSSMVVALMSKFVSQPVKTFSIGFDVKSHNELPYARIVASHFGTEHHEFLVDPKTIDLLPKLMQFFDEPFADSSAIPTYLVSQLAREYVKVALSGDGGDELFAGYYWTRRYQYIKYYQQLVPRSFRKALDSLTLGDDYTPERESNFMGKLRRFFYDSSVSFERSFTRRITCFTDGMKANLYSQQFKDQLGDYDSFEGIDGLFGKTQNMDAISRMLYVDTKMYLPDDCLCKVDRATMSVSLEGRVPILDHKLVEFAATIPSNLKLRGLTTKYILKKVASKFLPEEILKQRKQGFSIPVDHWFRTELKPLIHEIIFNGSVVQESYFNKEYLKWILEEHSQGRQNFGHQLWTIMILELWYRTYIKND